MPNRINAIAAIERSGGNSAKMKKAKTEANNGSTKMRVESKVGDINFTA